MRMDLNEICKLIPSHAKVLDLGCGKGDLLTLLTKNRKIEGTGIELNSELIHHAIGSGATIIQGDLESIVKDYPDNRFDYVILSQTIQDLRNANETLKQITRISKNALITFYNLAFWKYRAHVFFKGEFPPAKSLPYNWLESNIRFLSIKDFHKYCNGKKIQIREEIFYKNDKRITYMPNLRANYCIFKIS